MTGSKDSKTLKDVKDYEVHDYNIHIHTHKDDVVKKGAFYDETIPKNDPKFLTPIRRWEKRMGFETAIVWRNVILLGLVHIIGVVGFIYILPRVTLKLFMFTFIWGSMAGFGVTAGAHRYWTHRSYSAKLPMQIILVICFVIAGQNTILEWIRDHRVHHKCSETSADPHNANRGFFFSHVGWLMMKKHPHVIQEGRKIYLDDIRNDKLVTTSTRYFTILQILFFVALPVTIPVFLWGVHWDVILIITMTRYVVNLNCTWAVNSFAHLWGNKPYDRSIMPGENWAVSMVAMGEGWHNYHHTFPWDYKTAELAYFINFTTAVLDAFAAIGWVYDRKQATHGQIQYAVEKHAKSEQSLSIFDNKTK